MMKKRKLGCAAMMVAMVMLAAGCGNNGNGTDKTATDENLQETTGVSAGNRGDAVVVMESTLEPEAGFDPAYGRDAGKHVHESSVQSTLAVITPDLETDYDLATDMSVTDDGLIWTMKVRDDVSFSGGEKLTAEDAVFTYNTLRDISSVSGFMMLKEAKTLSDTTVEFQMSRPYSIWPYTMAIAGVVPEYAYGPNYGEHPIGSGRYLLKQWDKGQQVIFKANPDYYGKAPKTKKMTILLIDEDTAFAAVRSGQVDLAYTVTPYSDQVVDGFELLSFETVDNHGFDSPAIATSGNAGTMIGNGFISDVLVRRVINTAVDRDEMIEDILNSYGNPVYSVCDKMPWYNSTAKTDYNPEQATTLSEETGWVSGADGIREKDGKRVEVTLVYPASDFARQAPAADTSNRLRRIGIDVKTKGAGWDEAYDGVQSEPLMWGWEARIPMELHDIYHFMEGTGLVEYSPCANSIVDRYMSETLVSSDLEKPYELWQRAQWDGATGITQDGDTPWIWLVDIDHLYWSRNDLKVAEQELHPHGHG